MSGERKDTSSYSSDSSDDEEHEVESRSFISDGREIGECKLKVRGKPLQCISSIVKQKWRPGDVVPVQVKVSNETNRSIKSIQVCLYTTKVKPVKKVNEKKKWAKPIKSGTEEEYFEGARFPLPGYTDFHGEIKYTLPTEISNTDEDTYHCLVCVFPFKSLIKDSHARIELPIHIEKEFYFY